MMWKAILPTEMLLCSYICSTDQSYGHRMDNCEDRFRVVMDQDGVDAYKHTRRKERGQTAVIFAEQAWSIKAIYMASALASGKFFLRSTARNPESAR